MTGCGGMGIDGTAGPACRSPAGAARGGRIGSGRGAGCAAAISGRGGSGISCASGSAGGLNVVSSACVGAVKIWPSSLVFSSLAAVSAADACSSRAARRCSSPPAPVRRLRSSSATSSSTELEWVFFSVTPSSGRRSRIAPGFTSSSLASSLIRIFFILTDELSDPSITHHARNPAHSLLQARRLVSFQWSR